jgi:hypothetical protein
MISSTTIAAAAGRRRDPPPPPTTTTTARRAAPSRTYSEQVARLFGTERYGDDGDDDGDDPSNDPSSSSNANADFDEDNNNIVVDPRTADPRVPNPALSSAAAVGSTTSSSSSPVNNSRRSSAPALASSSSSSSPAPQQQQQQHRHSAGEATAAPTRPPRRPMPTNLLLRPITASTDTTSGGSGSTKSQESTGGWWKKGMGMAGMALVVAMAGLGLGTYRHARGQLQHELAAAMELHRALELEMADLQNEADRQLKHRSDQVRLEENMQQLNAELDDTERALQSERDKLSQRQEELERLVRAEQQQTSKSSATAGKGETTGHDVYAPFDVASPLMMGMATNVQQQQQPLHAGGDTVTGEDSLVGRLVQNLGVEQYGLRPRHVELHLEYHRRHPTTKRTSIHRRYILAQLSLLQRPITAFVFLQQVEHDLYDHVKLKIVKDTDTDNEEGGEMALHTQLSDRQRRQRSAMGLANVPVQEAASTYRNPLLLAMDENGTDTTASSDLQERHYHLALTDDGDLVISTALHRPGVFATVVHGDPVLDKLLLASSPSEEADAKKGHHPHPAKDMHVELISIRLLSSTDEEEDPSHSGEEDENEEADDDDDDEEKEEEALDRHDEH